MLRTLCHPTETMMKRIDTLAKSIGYAIINFRGPKNNLFTEGVDKVQNFLADRILVMELIALFALCPASMHSTNVRD